VSSVRIVTTYAAVALGVIALLFIGIRPGAWGLLRFVLAVHLLGDVLFGWVWSLMPTYAFMKYIDDADRIYAALFLAAAVCATDVTYRLSRRVGRFVAGRFSLALRRPTTAEARPGFSSAFLVAGLACKLVFLGATGVLTGERGLSELRPSDSIGLGAIVMLADFLIPYGVAALRRAGRAPWPVVGDLILLAVLSFLSFSKAAFITYALIYGLSFLLAEGWTRTRREFLNWRSVLIVVIAVLSLGIKSQQRAGMLVSLSSSVMTEQTMSGASARFMGGIFRAYTVAVREVRNGWPPLGGSYHTQAALLVIPRVLWPDKPHVASEQLYYLLGVTEEDYGTSFAINLYGAMVFDLGLLGCLIGAAVMGVVLQVGDTAIPGWRGLRQPSARGPTWQYFATMWVYLAVLLSEGGIPVAIVTGIGLTGAFLLVQTCNRMIYAVLAAASHAPPREAAA
jgi:hypothetical protein